MTPGGWRFVACVACGYTALAARIYRFDGWTRVAETRGGTTGKNGGWSRAKRIAPKVVWAWIRQPRAVRS